MYIATIGTRHFSFMAAGNTDAEARQALMKGWAHHCAEYSGADPDYMRADDLSVVEIHPGECSRDGSIIPYRVDQLDTNA